MTDPINAIYYNENEMVSVWMDVSLFVIELLIHIIDRTLSFFNSPSFVHFWLSKKVYVR